MLIEGFTFVKDASLKGSRPSHITYTDQIIPNIARKMKKKVTDVKKNFIENDKLMHDFSQSLVKKPDKEKHDNELKLIENSNVPQKLKDRKRKLTEDRITNEMETYVYMSRLWEVVHTRI